MLAARARLLREAARRAAGIGHNAAAASPRRTSSSSSSSGPNDAFRFVVHNILAALKPMEAGLDAASLNRFAQYLTHEIVLEVLQHASRKKGFQFFQWARQQHGYQHDALSYEALVQRLCEARECGRALLVLRAMRSDGLEPTIASLVALLRAYVDVGQIEEAREIFNYVKNAAAPPPEAYAHMIDALARVQQLDQALELSREALDRGLSPDHHALIYALSRAGRIDAAAELATALLDRGCHVGSVDCSVVVDRLSAAGKLDSAIAIVRRAAAVKIKVDGQAFNLLALKLFQAKRFADATQLFEELASREIVYGEATFRVVVDGLCRAGMSADALELLARVRGFYTPTVLVYNAIVAGLCRALKVMDAYAVLDRMVEESGVYPNAYTYNILLNGLCKAGRIKPAMAVLETMRKSGCEPSPITYATLIQHLSRGGGVDGALRLLVEQRGRELPTDVITCTTVVGALCNARRFDEALEFLGEMRRMDVPPNDVTYSNLVRGFARHGELEKVIEFFDKEKAAKGGALDAAAYPGFIEALCKAEDLDRALAELRGSNTVADVVTYSMLINGFAKAGRVDVALELLEGMGAKGVRPDVVTYTTLINMLCKKARFPDAYRILDAMAVGGAPPNVVTYNSVIDGLCKSGRMEEVHRVYEMMLKNRCAPDVVTYTIIMNGLSKAGKLDAAVKLFELMKTSSGGPDAAAYGMVIASLCHAGKLEEAFGMYEGMGETAVAAVGDTMWRSLSMLVHALCDAEKVDLARKVVEVAVQRGHSVTKSGDNLAAIIEEHCASKSRNAAAAGQSSNA